MKRRWTSGEGHWTDTSVGDLLNSKETPDFLG